MGEPLAKFWFLTSVGGNGSDSGVTCTGQKQATWGNPSQDFGSSLQLVKLIEYKNISVGGPLAQLQFLSSLGFNKEAESGKIDIVWVYVIKQF